MMELDLRFTNVKALSESFGCQSKLEILHLAYCYIKSFPSCFKNLANIRYLDVRYCQKLQTLPELPSSLEILLAQECTSLKTLLIPSIAEQFKENRKRVVFWNCLKLDENSLKAIGLNAQINMMEFAYQQHLSAPEPDFAEKNNDDYHDSCQVVYVYPGSRVSEWLEYRTKKDYIIIDLSSSSTTCSPLLGFIFCFVLDRFPTQCDKVKFDITISVTGEYEDKMVSIGTYMSKSSTIIESNHVCV
ncbi:Leucine-rich repeat domain superfamily [Sesbania bispinosa]|nr:Leucine-rich repeat domain superfamily [Sesbania bispinosa]